MFQTLHKIYVAIGWAIVLGVVALLIQHRAVFYPLVDLVDALRPRDGPEQKPSGELSGQVTRVLSGDMFDVKGDDGYFHRIRLTAVAAPEYQLTDRAEMRRAEQSQTNLGHLILSKRVLVKLTFTNESHGGLGILYVGTTNINVVAVESGIVRLKRDQMNGLPLKDRYALIQADRRAGEKKANEGD